MLSAIPALLFLAACASSTVDMSEPRRVVGTENAVRVDAEIGEELRPGAPVSITFAITNERAAPIAVADIVPESTWDPETRTVTVSLGSEVPGTTILPRLVKVEPGEKKVFTTAAHVRPLLSASSADPNVAATALLRLKVNFLTDIAPFAMLIDIPEKGIADAKLADELFAAWVEKNEAVYTNAVPVSLRSGPTEGSGADTRRRSPL